MKWKIVLIIIVSAIVGLAIWRACVNEIRQEQLMQHGRIAIATLRWTQGSTESSGSYFEFEFFAGDRKYVSATTLDKTYHGGLADYWGRPFPVMYYPSNPENNELLVLPENFEKYNMAYPDSLEWIIDEFED
jgi:hypothetical protein